MPLAPSRRRSSLADYGTLPALTAMRDEMGRLLDSVFTRPLAPGVFLEAGDGAALPGDPGGEQKRDQFVAAGGVDVVEHRRRG